MQEQDGLTPAERELGLALAGLQPTKPSINRDQLMFRAGRASVDHPGHLWQAATVLLVVALGVSFAVRPRPRGIERIVYVAKEPGPSGVTNWASINTPYRPSGNLSIEADYLKLRQAVLAHGLDELATSATSSTNEVGSTEFLEDYLGLPAGTPNRRGLIGGGSQINQGERL